MDEGFLRELEEVRDQLLQVTAMEGEGPVLDKTLEMLDRIIDRAREPAAGTSQYYGMIPQAGAGNGGERME